MKKIKVIDIERQYNNDGQHLQQALTYTLTGEHRKADHVSYTKDSDIPEFEMSVKSARFTLMSGNLCEAQDFEGIVNEFFRKTASKCFAYVTKELECFIMDAEEFREFICQFCGLSKESSKNGGRCKVQMRSESSKVMQWLQTSVA